MFYNDATSYDRYHPFIYIYISVMYQIVHEKISDLQDHHMLMPSTEKKKKKKEATFHCITKPCFMTLKKK